MTASCCETFSFLDPTASRAIPGSFKTRILRFSPPGTRERNPWYYEQIAIGFNYRITDIQCALGLSQLGKLDRFKRRRREIVVQYNHAFQGIPFVKTPFEVGDRLQQFSSLCSSD